MSLNNKLLSAAFLVATASAAPALADNCSGWDVLVTQSAETLDVGNGHTITVLRAYSIVIDDDPKSIYNLMTGECHGTFLSTPDGKVQSQGYCARRDQAGDTESIEWSQAVGAKRGQWRHTGGTGKFAGRNDSGWFEDARSDGKMFVTRWGGTCK